MKSCFLIIIIVTGSLVQDSAARPPNYKSSKVAVDPPPADVPPDADHDDNMDASDVLRLRRRKEPFAEQNWNLDDAPWDGSNGNGVDLPWGDYSSDPFGGYGSSYEDKYPTAKAASGPLDMEGLPQSLQNELVNLQMSATAKSKQVCDSCESDGTATTEWTFNSNPGIAPLPSYPGLKSSNQPQPWIMGAEMLPNQDYPSPGNIKNVDFNFPDIPSEGLPVSSTYPLRVQAPPMSEVTDDSLSQKPCQVPMNPNYMPLNPMMNIDSMNVDNRLAQEPCQVPMKPNCMPPNPTMNVDNRLAQEPCQVPMKPNCMPTNPPMNVDNRLAQEPCQVPVKPNCKTMNPAVSVEQQLLDLARQQQDAGDESPYYVSDPGYTDFKKNQLLKAYTEQKDCVLVQDPHYMMYKMNQQLDNDLGIQDPAVFVNDPQYKLNQKNKELNHVLEESDPSILVKDPQYMFFQKNKQLNQVLEERDPSILVKDPQYMFYQKNKQLNQDLEERDPSILVKDPQYMLYQKNKQLNQNIEEKDPSVLVKDPQFMYYQKNKQLNQKIEEQDPSVLVKDPQYMFYQKNKQLNKELEEQDPSVLVKDPQYMLQKKNMQLNKKLELSDPTVLVTDPKYLLCKKNKALNDRLEERDPSVLVTDPRYLLQKKNRLLNKEIEAKEGSILVTDPEYLLYKKNKLLNKNLDEKEPAVWISDPEYVLYKKNKMLNARLDAREPSILISDPNYVINRKNEALNSDIESFEKPCTVRPPERTCKPPCFRHGTPFKAFVNDKLKTLQDKEGVLRKYQGERGKGPPKPPTSDAVAERIVQSKNRNLAQALAEEDQQTAQPVRSCMLINNRLPCEPCGQKVDTRARKRSVVGAVRKSADKSFDVQRLPILMQADLILIEKNRDLPPLELKDDVEEEASSGEDTDSVEDTEKNRDEQPAEFEDEVQEEAPSGEEVASVEDTEKNRDVQPAEFENEVQENASSEEEIASVDDTQEAQESVEELKNANKEYEDVTKEGLRDMIQRILGPLLEMSTSIEKPSLSEDSGASDQQQDLVVDAAALFKEKNDALTRRLDDERSPSKLRRLIDRKTEHLRAKSQAEATAASRMMSEKNKASSDHEVSGNRRLARVRQRDLTPQGPSNSSKLQNSNLNLCLNISCPSNTNLSDSSRNNVSIELKESVRKPAQTSELGVTTCVPVTSSNQTNIKTGNSSKQNQVMTNSTVNNTNVAPTSNQSGLKSGSTGNSSVNSTTGQAKNGNTTTNSTNRLVNGGSVTTYDPKNGKAYSSNASSTGNLTTCIVKTTTMNPLCTNSTGNYIKPTTISGSTVLTTSKSANVSNNSSNSGQPKNITISYSYTLKPNAGPSTYPFNANSSSMVGNNTTNSTKRVGNGDVIIIGEPRNRTTFNNFTSSTTGNKTEKFPGSTSSTTSKYTTNKTDNCVGSSLGYTSKLQPANITSGTSLSTTSKYTTNKTDNYFGSLSSTTSKYTTNKTDNYFGSLSSTTSKYTTNKTDSYLESISSTTSKYTTNKTDNYLGSISSTTSKYTTNKTDNYLGSILSTTNKYTTNKTDNYLGSISSTTSKYTTNKTDIYLGSLSSTSSKYTPTKTDTTIGSLSSYSSTTSKTPNYLGGSTYQPTNPQANKTNNFLPWDTMTSSTKQPIYQATPSPDECKPNSVINHIQLINIFNHPGCNETNSDCSEIPKNNSAYSSNPLSSTRSQTQSSSTTTAKPQSTAYYGLNAPTTAQPQSTSYNGLNVPVSAQTTKPTEQWYTNTSRTPGPQMNQTSTRSEDPKNWMTTQNPSRVETSKKVEFTEPASKLNGSKIDLNDSCGRFSTTNPAGNVSPTDSKSNEIVCPKIKDRTTQKPKKGNECKTTVAGKTTAKKTQKTRKTTAACTTRTTRSQNSNDMDDIGCFKISETTKNSKLSFDRRPTTSNPIMLQKDCENSTSRLLGSTTPTNRGNTDLNGSQNCSLTAPKQQVNGVRENAEQSRSSSQIQSASLRPAENVSKIIQCSDGLEIPKPSDVSQKQIVDFNRTSQQSIPVQSPSNKNGNRSSKGNKLDSFGCPTAPSFPDVSTPAWSSDTFLFSQAYDLGSETFDCPSSEETSSKCKPTAKPKNKKNKKVTKQPVCKTKKPPKSNNSKLSCFHSKEKTTTPKYIDQPKCEPTQAPHGSCVKRKLRCPIGFQKLFHPIDGKCCTSTVKHSKDTLALMCKLDEMMTKIERSQQLANDGTSPLGSFIETGSSRQQFPPSKQQLGKPAKPQVNDPYLNAVQENAAANRAEFPRVLLANQIPVNLNRTGYKNSPVGSLATYQNASSSQNRVPEKAPLKTKLIQRGEDDRTKYLSRNMIFNAQSGDVASQENSASQYASGNVDTSTAQSRSQADCFGPSFRVTTPSSGMFDEDRPDDDGQPGKSIFATQKANVAVLYSPGKSLLNTPSRLAGSTPPSYSGDDVDDVYPASADRKTATTSGQGMVGDMAGIAEMEAVIAEHEKNLEVEAKRFRGKMKMLSDRMKTACVSSPTTSKSPASIEYVSSASVYGYPMTENPTTPMSLRNSPDTDMYVAPKMSPAIKTMPSDSVDLFTLADTDTSGATKNRQSSKTVDLFTTPDTDMSDATKNSLDIKTIASKTVDYFTTTGMSSATKNLPFVKTKESNATTTKPGSSNSFDPSTPNCPPTATTCAPGLTTWSPTKSTKFPTTTICASKCRTTRKHPCNRKTTCKSSCAHTSKAFAEFIIQDKNSEYLYQDVEVGSTTPKKVDKNTFRFVDNRPLTSPSTGDSFTTSPTEAEVTSTPERAFKTTADDADVPVPVRTTTTKAASAGTYTTSDSTTTADCDDDLDFESVSTEPEVTLSTVKEIKTKHGELIPDEAAAFPPEAFGKDERTSKLRGEHTLKWKNTRRGSNSQPVKHRSASRQKRHVRTRNVVTCKTPKPKVVTEKPAAKEKNNTILHKMCGQTGKKPSIDIKTSHHELASDIDREFNKTCNCSDDASEGEAEFVTNSKASVPKNCQGYCKAKTKKLDHQNSDDGKQGKSSRRGKKAYFERNPEYDDDDVRPAKKSCSQRPAVRRNKKPEASDIETRNHELVSEDELKAARNTSDSERLDTSLRYHNNQLKPTDKERKNKGGGDGDEEHDSQSKFKLWKHKEEQKKDEVDPNKQRHYVKDGKPLVHFKDCQPKVTNKTKIKFFKKQNKTEICEGVFMNVTGEDDFTEGEKPPKNATNSVKLAKDESMGPIKTGENVNKGTRNLEDGVNKGKPAAEDESELQSAQKKEAKCDQCEVEECKRGFFAKLRDKFRRKPHKCKDNAILPPDICCSESEDSSRENSAELDDDVSEDLGEKMDHEHDDAVQKEVRHVEKDGDGKADEKDGGGSEEKDGDSYSLSDTLYSFYNKYF